MEMWCFHGRWGLWLEREVPAERYSGLSQDQRSCIPVQDPRATRCHMPLPTRVPSLATLQHTQAPRPLQGSAQRPQPKGNRLRQKLLSCQCLKPVVSFGANCRGTHLLCHSWLIPWEAQMADTFLAFRDPGLRNKRTLPLVTFAPRPE